MFTEKFSDYVCHGDSICCDVGNVTYTARIMLDTDARPDDFDCYNEELIAAWKRDEWHFYGVVIDAELDGWVKRDIASLWGLEGNVPGSDNAYLLDRANELLADILARAVAA